MICIPELHKHIDLSNPSGMVYIILFSRSLYAIKVMLTLNGWMFDFPHQSLDSNSTKGKKNLQPNVYLQIKLAQEINLKKVGRYSQWNIGTLWIWN